MCVFQLWAHAFRSAKFQVLSNTNMGLQSFDKAVSRLTDELASCKEYSISALLTFLVEKFLPEDYKELVTLVYCSHGLCYCC